MRPSSWDRTSTTTSPTRRWRAGEGFDAAEVRSYGWVQEYDPRSYGELLRTHSDHRLLDPRRLDKLVAAVENAIERPRRPDRLSVSHRPAAASPEALLTRE